MVGFVASAVFAAEPVPHQQKTTTWATFDYPTEVAVGAELVIEVTPIAVTAAGELCANTHAVIDGKREKPFGKTAHQSIRANDPTPITLHITVAAKDGLTAVLVPVFISSDGTWKNKILSTELGPVTIIPNK